MATALTYLDNWEEFCLPVCSSGEFVSIKYIRENSLFDTALKLCSLFGPGKIFLTNLTPKLDYVPGMTL
jgi:hypothetical protein